jgi:hypothetical protein
MRHNPVREGECGSTLNLTMECSRVCQKKLTTGLWLTIDRDTREIVGVHIGDRHREGVYDYQFLALLIM